MSALTEAGVWCAFIWEYNAGDVRPFASEVAAYREVNKRGYGSVIFVPYGETVDEAYRAGQTS